MAGESRRRHREAGRNGTREEMDTAERGEAVERRVCKDNILLPSGSPDKPGQQHEKEPMKGRAQLRTKHMLPALQVLHRSAPFLAVQAAVVMTAAMAMRAVRAGRDKGIGGGGKEGVLTGNKRKCALADIKADIANKRLFVRKGLPPTGGELPTHKGGDHPLHPHPSPNTNGKHNQYGEDSDNSSTNSTDSTDCHHDTPWEVDQDRGGPRPGNETRLDALLGRFAGPGPLLVLCCIRLVLNGFSTTEGVLT
jgi:hypothetical protein